MSCVSIWIETYPSTLALLSTAPILWFYIDRRDYGGFSALYAGPVVIRPESFQRQPVAQVIKHEALEFLGERRLCDQLLCQLPHPVWLFVHDER
jgi:hypothetical protein